MAISEELWTWVDQGPPRASPRGIAGVEAYEDELSCGFGVVYIADEAQHYVAVLRIRRR